MKSRAVKHVQSRSCFTNRNLVYVRASSAGRVNYKVNMGTWAQWPVSGRAIKGEAVSRITVLQVN